MAALREATELGLQVTPAPKWLPEVYRLTAEIHNLRGQQHEAMKNYERYLEVAPESALDRDEIEAIIRAYKGED